MITHTSITDLLGLKIFNFFKVYSAISRVLTKQREERK